MFTVAINFWNFHLQLQRSSSRHFQLIISQAHHPTLAANCWHFLCYWPEMLLALHTLCTHITLALRLRFAHVHTIGELETCLASGSRKYASGWLKLVGHWNFIHIIISSPYTPLCVCVLHIFIFIHTSHTHLCACVRSFDILNQQFPHHSQVERINKISKSVVDRLDMIIWIALT